MDIDSLMKRTARYQYENGLAEIVIGSVCLLAALVLVLASALFSVEDSTTFIMPLTAAGLIGLAVLGIWMITKSSEAVKERLVYPRTGYVRYRTDEQESRKISQTTMWISILITCLLPAANALFLFLAVGLVFTYILVYYARKVDIRRFYAEAAFTSGLVIGVLLARSESGWNDIETNAVYFALLGAVMLVIGGVIFGKYVSAHE